MNGVAYRRNGERIEIILLREQACLPLEIVASIIVRNDRVVCSPCSASPLLLLAVVHVPALIAAEGPCCF